MLTPPDTIYDRPGEDITTASGPELTTGELSRGDTLGRYVVLDHLGEGGMSVVVTAYDPQLDRKVALKILQPGGNDQHQARLVREAQALARLNHPNVVAVYDVGSLNDSFFITMEYVRGRTLKDWLDAEQRSVDEIVAVFRDAGEGLLAAHRAGLVHRDFKTSNVMVGDDGRVQVLDFGLARTHTPDVEATANEEDSQAEEDSEETLKEQAAEDAAVVTLLSGHLEAPLTQTGAILGTPRFMAPEQVLGRDVGPAADQYSFCVALYWALYGRYPTEGKWTFMSRPELPAAGADGQRIPDSLGQLLRRGLSHPLEDRYPSMEALLRDLEGPPRKRWPWLAAFFAVGLLGLAFLVGDAVRRQSQLCGGASASLNDVWNDDRRQTLEKVFMASGLPYAGDVWQTTQAAFDGYRDHWERQYEETCQATHRSGVQSLVLLDLRMDCLRQRREEFRALTEIFADSTQLAEDPGFLERAPQVVNDLPPISACAERASLMLPLEPPSDEEMRRQVQELRDRLATARALQIGGRYDDGATIAEEVTAASEKLGYWPLVAEARLQLGLLREQQADAEGAAVALRDALFAAQAARHDRVAAEAFVRLVRVDGYQRQDFAMAHENAAYATALMERLEQGQDLEATLAGHLGVVYFHEGKLAEAEVHHRQALAILESSQNARARSEIPRALRRVGDVFFERGNFRGALEYFEQARQANESLFGLSHPRTATSLTKVGHAALELGDYDLAERSYHQSLEIQQRLRGPEHSRIASGLTHLARVESARGAHQVAIERYLEAQKIYEVTKGPDHSNVAFLLANMSTDLIALGQLEEARQVLERAIEILKKTYGDDHPWVATMVFNHADVLDRLGRHAEAEPRFRRALDVWTETYGADHYMVAAALTELGGALRGLNRAVEAVPLLERALVIQEATEQDPKYLAETEFELARCLLAAAGPSTRAREKAQSALALLEGKDHKNAAAIEEIRRWLAQYPKP